MADPVVHENKWRYSYSGADVRATVWFPHQMTPWGAANKALTRALNTRQNAIEQQQADLQGAQAAIQDGNADAAANFLASAQALGTTITSQEEAAQSAATEISNKGPQPLESIHTVSISIHEPKGAARALGYRGIKGFASSVRTIAGSMVFTVVEGHPLEKLMLRDTRSALPWSADQNLKGSGAIAGSAAYSPEQRTDIKLATLLSPFDMMLTYTSELPKTVMSEGYTSITNAEISTTQEGRLTLASSLSPTFGITDRSETTSLTADQDQGVNLVATTNSAALMLQGIRFMTEGIVTSVNDMVTEIVYQFVAVNMVEFSQHHFGTKPIQQLTQTEQGLVMAAYTEELDSDLWIDPEMLATSPLDQSSLRGMTSVTIETEPSAAELDFSLGDDYSLFPDNLSMDRHIRSVGALGMGPYKGRGGE